MKKSIGKTIIKSTIITLGILLFLSSLINPLIYFCGAETTGICDNVVFTPTENDLFSVDISYHYFANGKEYNSTILLADTEYDESLSLSHHSIKYFPLAPSYEIFATNYTIPLKNLLLSAVGIILMISGCFIKTLKKESTDKDFSEIPKFRKVYICPSCQKEIDSDSIFCNYCGRKIIGKL